MITPGDESALLAACRAGLAVYREAARRAAPLVRERFSSARVAGQYDACWRKAMGFVGK